MDPQTGGVAATIRNLLPVLDRMNICSEVVCFDAPVPTLVEQQDGFLLHRIGPASGPWGRLPGFMQWLDQHACNFDVVLLHGLWLYNGYAYTKWIRARRSQPGVRLPRTWLMPHGMLDPWFQQSPGRRFKSIRNYIYWHLIEKKTIASADLLIFTSEAERKKASLCFSGYNPRDTVVIPLGVPDPLQHISSGSSQDFLPEFQEKGFLLALGRIDPKKGFDLLPEVWMRLKEDERYFDRLPHLLIAGPGWETEYGCKLKSRIRKLEIGDRVHISGMLQGAAKWQALRSCAAMIMPSHQENFGLVAAEALACGTPVLISDQVDIHSLITGGQAGVSDHDTLDGMERLIREWMDMKQEEKSKMKIFARNVFLDHFDINITADRFRDLLEEMEY